MGAFLEVIGEFKLKTLLLIFIRLLIKKSNKFFNKFQKVKERIGVLFRLSFMV